MRPHRLAHVAARARAASDASSCSRAADRVLGREELRGASHGERLEGEPDGEELPQLLDVEPGDLRAVVRDVLREPERLESAHGLAHRRDARPERVGEILEAERRARRELAEDDRLAQTLECRLRHRAVTHRVPLAQDRLHEDEREPHLIRCQMRERMRRLRVTRVHAAAPRFSISQVSTLTASFAEDMRAYAAAGVDGVGIWEMKLGDGSTRGVRARADLARRPLSRSCRRSMPLPLLPGPETVRERVDSLLRSLEVLAPVRSPAAILCFTGPATARPPCAGVARSRAEAERLGLRLAVEPFQREGIESWSILNTLGDAAEFVDEVGSDAVGIQFDVWHLWNTPDLFEEIPRYAHLIAGVHVSDYREPTRGWADRVLPGDGVADVPQHSRRARRRRLGRLLRPRDLLRQRRVRNGVSRTRSGISTPPILRAAAVTLSSTTGRHTGGSLQRP